MKHIIGIYLVDPTDKQYSTVRTYRGMEYEEGEELITVYTDKEHKKAEKFILDLAQNAHDTALKRAGVNIREVNEKFKPLPGTSADQVPPVLFKPAKEELEDTSALTWKDDEILINYQPNKEAQRIMQALIQRVGRHSLTRGAIEILCEGKKYTVIRKDNYLRRTPVNGK